MNSILQTFNYKPRALAILWILEQVMEVTFKISIQILPSANGQRNTLHNYCFIYLHFPKHLQFCHGPLVLNPLLVTVSLGVLCRTGPGW